MLSNEDNTNRYANERSVPQEYICVITQEIMEEPVMAEDGWTYEKSAIQRWM